MAWSYPDSKGEGGGCDLAGAISPARNAPITIRAPHPAFARANLAPLRVSAEARTLVCLYALNLLHVHPNVAETTVLPTCKARSPHHVQRGNFLREFESESEGLA